MICPTCGIDNLNDANFCKDCGTALDALGVGGTRLGPKVLPMVSFPEAVKLGFQRYFDFTGRSTRAEHWWWVLFNVLCYVVVAVIAGALGGTSVPFIMFFFLLTLVPSFSVLVRRLHDTNKSGWWLFLQLVPIIGPIAMLVFTVQETYTGTNQYGPDPRVATAQQSY